MFGLEGLEYKLPPRKDYKSYRIGMVLANANYNLNTDPDSPPSAGLVYVRDKPSGIEPGFMALKYDEAFFLQVKVIIFTLLSKTKFKNKKNDVKADIKARALKLARKASYQLLDDNDITYNYKDKEQARKTYSVLHPTVAQNNDVSKEQEPDISSQLARSAITPSDDEILGMLVNLNNKCFADIFMQDPEIAAYVTNKIISKSHTTPVPYFKEYLQKIAANNPNALQPSDEKGIHTIQVMDNSALTSDILPLDTEPTDSVALEIEPVTSNELGLKIDPNYFSDNISHSDEKKPDNAAGKEITVIKDDTSQIKKQGALSLPQAMHALTNLSSKQCVELFLQDNNIRDYLTNCFIEDVNMRQLSVADQEEIIAAAVKANDFNDKYSYAKKIINGKISIYEAIMRLSALHYNQLLKLFDKKWQREILQELESYKLLLNELYSIIKNNTATLINDNNKHLVRDLKNLTIDEAIAVFATLPQPVIAELFIKNPKLASHVAGKIKLALPNYDDLITTYFIKQDYCDPWKFPNGVFVPLERAYNTNSIKKIELYFKKNFGSYLGTIIGRPLRWLAAAIYSIFRTRPRDEENMNATREVMATEIAAKWGMKTHQQALCESSYSDGHIKFSTISTWENNFTPLTNEQEDLDDEDSKFGIVIKGGDYNYGNYIAEPDTTGQYRSYNKIKNLGEHLALAIVLADTDHISSTGRNKGKIRCKDSTDANELYELFYIDMGQSLRRLENPLLKYVQDDFSLNLPASSKFKNFSVFSDTPLSEKMRGIYRLHKLRTGNMPPDYILDEYDPLFKAELGAIEEDADLEVFDRYETLFNERYNTGKKTAAAYKEYLKQIQRAKRNHPQDTRKLLIKFNADKILTVEEANLPGNINDVQVLEILNKCQKRFKDFIQHYNLNAVKYKTYAQQVLSVRNTYLNDTKTLLKIFAARKELSPSELDFLDNMEKLSAVKIDKTSAGTARITSASSIRSPDGSVILNHLRVEPGKRIIWQLQRPVDKEGEYILSTQLAPGQNARVLLRWLQIYMRFANYSGDKFRFTLYNGQIQLRLTKTNIAEAKELFKESTIIAFVKQQKLLAKRKSKRISMQGLLVEQKSRRSAQTLNAAESDGCIIMLQLANFEKDIEHKLAAVVKQKTSGSTIDKENVVKALEQEAETIIKLLDENLAKALNKERVNNRIVNLKKKLAHCIQQKIKVIDDMIQEQQNYEQLKKEVMLLDEKLRLTYISSQEALEQTLMRLNLLEKELQTISSKARVVYHDDTFFASNSKDKVLALELKAIKTKIEERKVEALLNHLPVHLLKYTTDANSQPLFNQWLKQHNNKYTRHISAFKKELAHCLYIESEKTLLAEFKAILDITTDKDKFVLQQYILKHTALKMVLFKYHKLIAEAEKAYSLYENQVLADPGKRRKSEYRNSFTAFKPKGHLVPEEINSDTSKVALKRKAMQ